RGVVHPLDLEIDRAGPDHSEYHPNGEYDRPRLQMSPMGHSGLYYPTLALIFHVSRRRLGHFAAEVPLNDVQCEIDSGRQTSCSRDLLVLDKAQSTLESYVGKCLCKLIEEVVMRGGFLA